MLKGTRRIRLAFVATINSRTEYPTILWACCGRNHVRRRMKAFRGQGATYIIWRRVGGLQAGNPGLTRVIRTLRSSTQQVSDEKAHPETIERVQSLCPECDGQAMAEARGDRRAHPRRRGVCGVASLRNHGPEDRISLVGLKACAAASSQSACRITTAASLPPKASDVEMPHRTGCTRAWLATTSTSHSGSVCEW